jgi:ADP-ribosyl-[dinitrogen reductase] hydrolase
MREKIKNSIRAYIIGDTLGVPFEFKKEGSFYCNDFSSGGFHNQIEGTWSDDTSVLLCLIDALSNEGKTALWKFKQFQKNLYLWYNDVGFNAGSYCFDIGGQTCQSIMQRGCEESDRMGNGALFYSLPIAIATLNDSDDYTRRIFKMFCSYTHNNDNCFKFGSDFCCVLKKLLRDLPTENLEVNDYQNAGDVINTYNLVIDNYLAQENKNSTLFEDLCCIVNLGEDTDTNAAIFGAIMGTRKKVLEKDWIRVRRYKEIDEVIDKFLDSVIK